MGNIYTTDQLILDILLLGHTPTGNNTFTSTKILRLANFELQLPITEQILSTRGGYYLTYLDYEIVADGLYVLPEDAIGGALANVELVQEPSIIPVNLIDETEQFSTNSPTSTSYGYFFKGNYIQILPTPNIGVARLWFFKRTSEMILTADAAQITGISGATYTVSSIPTDMVEGSFVDLVQDQPPFNILGDDLEIQVIAGTDITFTDEIPEASVGDWIAFHNQTPVPQIPVEFRLLLAQRVVVKIYELQGYLEKMKVAQEKLMEYEKSTFKMLTPRNQGQTKTIMPVNGGVMAYNGMRFGNFPASRSS